MKQSGPDSKFTLSFFEKIHRKTPLTIKIMVLTIVVGIILWTLLDYFQSSKLKKIFHIRLLEKLSLQAMDDRISFDRYIKSYHKSVELLVTQKKFSNYVNNQTWSSEDSIQIKYYRDTPPWFPNPTVLRLFSVPRFALLLDSDGKVREFFHIWHNVSAVPSLLQPTQLMIHKSFGQSYITGLDGNPYIISSAKYLDDKGMHKSTLMVSSPIDEAFLIASFNTITPGHLIAILSSGEKQRVLVSSNMVEIPIGTPIESLKERYIVTGQEASDYGASEFLLRLSSFMSMAEVDKFTSSAIATGRQQRNIIAPAFILVFTLIMYYLTRRISRLNQRISDFSTYMLGTPKESLRRGDQLYALEERFHRLTDEIINAREMLKRQAEEKTHMIVENAFDAIVTVDANDVITTWNPQAETIFKWKREDAVGSKVKDTIFSSSDDPKTSSSSLGDILAETKGPEVKRKLLLNASDRNGHTIPIELAISQAGEGDSRFYITVIRDISERLKAEEQIKTSLSEKELLLREIHHRVKNNMQIICSLIRLQSAQISNKKHVEFFKDSYNRIKSMSLIHEKLYKSKDLSHIDFNDYISDLLDNLYRSYGYTKGNVKLTINVKNILLGIDTAIPLGLIINELVSNSFKYAFPEDSKGEVEIILTRTHDNELELTVSDNGVGMPGNIDFRKTESLGLQLVTTLSEDQLLGNVTLNKTNGTKFKISFKEIKYEERV